MATIRSYQTKDGQTRYMIDYYIPKDIAGTDRPKKVTKRGFKTKKAAEDVLLERQVWLRDGTHERKTQRKRHTFDDLTAQYTEIFDSQPSWKESKQYMVERFSEDFKGRLLSSFTYLEMQKYRVKLTKTRITRKVGRKVKKYGFPTEATVNRYIACLRHMLGCAVEWEMLATNPFEGKKSLQVREEKRDRWLSEDEIERFLKHCKVNHVADFFIIAVNTGMDKGEILQLKWEQIKNNHIYCPKVKTRPERHIPISPDLDEHLQEIKSRKVVSQYVVVDGRGNKLTDIKRSFKTVCRSAGIHEFRIKDLRHTFASHFSMKTGDIKALQEILGHTSLKMTSRYTHLCQVHKAEQMQKMTGLTSRSRADVERFAYFPQKRTQRNPLSP